MNKKILFLVLLAVSGLVVSQVVKAKETEEISQKERATISESLSELVDHTVKTAKDIAGKAEKKACKIIKSVVKKTKEESAKLVEDEGYDKNKEFYIVKRRFPNCDIKDIKVEVSTRDGITFLTISVSKQEKITRENKYGIQIQESSFASSKSLSLTKDIDTSSMTTKYEDDMLTVSFKVKK